MLWRETVGRSASGLLLSGDAPFHSLLRRRGGVRGEGSDFIRKARFVCVVLFVAECQVYEVCGSSDVLNLIGRLCVAPHEEIGCGTRESHIECVERIHASFQVLSLVVGSKHRTADILRVGGNGKCAQLVERLRFGLAPKHVALTVALYRPMTEGQQDGVELQAFRLVDGQDTDACYC